MNKVYITEMGKIRYFLSTLWHRVPEFEAQGWWVVAEDHDNPSGALAAMGEVPVLMEKDEEPCEKS